MAYVGMVSSGLVLGSIQIELTGSVCFFTSLLQPPDLTQRSQFARKGTNPFNLSPRINQMS